MAGPDFVVVDFELANASFASICSIGAARVRDGRLAGTRHWFVRPPHPYDFVSGFQSNLTGITAGDLAGAQGFDFHGPNLLRNLDGGILVGHGIASADLPMLTQSWFAHRLGTLPAVRYLDTVPMCKQLLPHLDRHRLNLVYADLFGQSLDGHHRADVDAEATARILLELLERSGTSIEDWTRLREPQAGCVLKPPWGRESGAQIAPHAVTT